MRRANLKKLNVVVSAVLLGLLCACIRTDYKSIAEFPPLPQDMKVVTYYDRSQFPVPEKEQILVGDASASAYSSSFTLNDIKQKLVRMARARGANAVLIQNIEHKLDGQVRTDQVKNMSAPTWTPVDDSSTDAQQQRYMDLYSSAKDGELPVYKITITAQFYKLPDQVLVKERILLSEPLAEPRREETPEKEPQIRIQERNTSELSESKTE
ncbi:MAG: hypothetical protein J5858_17185 [Lentisphaeria bacterium]|nr:hypothetical protein [Lentisphaeria bacterium]